MQNPPVHHQSIITPSWNRSSLPVGGAERVYLLLEIEGPVRPAAGPRQPVNLSLVLDRSGSMSGEPLAYCKEACRVVLDRLNERDTVSIVTFDDDVQPMLPPTKVTNREALLRLVDGIEAGGCTNLSGGLAAGAQFAASAQQPGTVSRVMLLSDGYANRGVTNRQKLAAMAAGYRAEGVGVTTLGVGDGFDEELMEVIAEQGGGSFHYIRTPDRIPAIVEEELGSLLAVSAQGLVLTVQPSTGAVVTKVYGCPSEPGPGELQASLTLLLGDLFEGERKSVLLELDVAPHSEGAYPLLSLQLAYTDAAEGAVHRAVSCDVYAVFTADPVKLDLPDDEHVRRQIELTLAGEAIARAMAALDDGDLQTGKQLLKLQVDRMVRMSDELAEPTLAQEAGLLAEQLDDFAYTSSARKALHERKYRYNKRKL